MASPPMRYMIGERFLQTDLLAKFDGPGSLDDNFLSN